MSVFRKSARDADGMSAGPEGGLIVMDAPAMSGTMRSSFGLGTVARALSEFDVGQWARPRSRAQVPAGGAGGGPGSGSRPRCCWPPSLLALLSAKPGRSEEHTSELQSLMRISYAVFCLKKKK